MSAPPERAQGLGADWRRRAQDVQERTLAGAARVTVSCPAPYAGGGLGRHLEEIVQALGRTGTDVSVICEGREPGEAAVPPPARGPGRAELLRAARPLTRFLPAWRMLSVSAAFDADAARRLPPADRLIAFNGTALGQFRRAREERRLGSPALVSANSHIENMLERIARAHREYPVERSWAARLGPRNLREYELAKTIYCSCAYIRDSFLSRGFAEERLAMFPLTPAARFEPAPFQQPDTFDIVYCGSLVVHKGVPLLIDAFSRCAAQDVRLVLVGGWKTRSMRRFLEAARARDPRISVSPGDPLPHLRSAALCVHPAYEDGFAYAPAEALACGVPVIVSEDTGMKELIASEREGLVVPTGDAAALAEAIGAAARGEILTRA